MSHFFHTAPFPCCTFLCSNLFMLHYFLVVPFSCWTFFILHNFSFVLLSCCALFMNCTFVFHFYTLQGFRFAFFSCFTLRMLQFFLLHFVQKQPPRGGALKKRCSENMQQIYRRTPILKCDINKVAKQLYWNPTLAWVFPCKFAAYLQNTFSEENLCLADSICSCFTISKGVSRIHTNI